MSNVFVSFLGIGDRNSRPGYKKADYCWPEKAGGRVRAHFAQTAILRFLAEKQETVVDRCVLLCTAESKEKHAGLLEAELRFHISEQCPEICIPEPLVPTEMTPENQWGWFEQLLLELEREDSLVIDFTHGMRAVPIVFSSAIGFLQRAKNVRLLHALYAWYDPSRNEDEPHPIVDMKDFYMINDWSESVSRLIDDADVKKMARLAGSGQLPPQLHALADRQMVSRLDEMTDAIRNVEVNAIGEKVHRALTKVAEVRAGAIGSARLMLDLIRDKFCGLAFSHPPSGHYDGPYFKTQLEIIATLLEHRLYMQAYTAMRELIASLGMIDLHGKYRKQMRTKKGREHRRNFAEAFVAMMWMEQGEWGMVGARERDKLLPLCRRLSELGLLTDLQELTRDIRQIRNGFDHAWTSKKEVERELRSKGLNYHDKLNQIIERLAESDLLKQGEED